MTANQLVVQADPKRLEQVLSNLVMNAIKFTPRGRIAIRARRRLERIEIVIADTGVGIAAGQLRRVFEEFVQVEAGTVRRYDGTGLGLPLAHRLTELMGGTLHLRSVEGRGTRAHLRLLAG